MSSSLERLPLKHNARGNSPRVTGESAAPLGLSPEVGSLAEADKNGSSGGVTCDEEIEALGTGAFVWLAAAVCGMGNAADAMEVSCLSFVLPQLTDVSDASKGLLTAAIFGGMLLGGAAAGFGSDALGRKPCLVASLAINTVFGLLSALAPSWPWLAAPASAT